MDDHPTGPFDSRTEALGFDDGLRKRKKEKARNVWISFIGRIVAQIVGAVASIALAITFLQRNATDTTPAVTEAGLATPASALSAVGNTSRSGPIALAVLPLSNYSAGSEQDYFTDGMTEALIADLAQIEGIRVISRTSVMQYRGTAKTIPQVGRELGADMVVEGSVLRVGGRVRITAQLIDAATDHHVWARSYERTMRDVLTLQGQVAAEIAREVRGAMTPIQQARLERKRQIDPEIYDLYLRGRQAWNLRTEEGSQIAVAAFEEVIRRDPTFALAYSGLSDVYLLPATRVNPTELGDTRAKALVAANKALELDETLAEAHTSRAGLYFFHERNLPAAEREFKRAIELNPGYATAHQWYALLLSEVGRDKEALARAKEGVAIDPLMPMMHQALGIVHYLGRRHAEAVTTLERALELSPQLPLARTTLAKALVQRGAFKQALSVVDAASGPKSPDMTAIAGVAAFRAGDTARAKVMLAELHARTPQPVVALAQWYSATGDRARAVDLLSQLRPGQLPPTLGVEPMFDALRSDPRFVALLKRG